MAPRLTFAVLTISDTCIKDASKDSSGPFLVEHLRKQFENSQIHSSILPDEQLIIEQKLRQLIKETPTISCIITTGGTGFAPRDVTPEATKSVLEKECAQLSMLLAMKSMQKTKFAALSRGVCGIANKTLILNFPGSEKAVRECFEIISELLPHALQLINDELPAVKATHTQLQVQTATGSSTMIAALRHICPHKTGKGDGRDRNSPFDMLPVAKALEIVLQAVSAERDYYKHSLMESLSPVDIPPFRASIKDGYAMSSAGLPGIKKVLGCIAAGDEINMRHIAEDECFKINTGAPVPQHADCVVQVEDTVLLKSKIYGAEDLVEILVQPQANLDIRPIGCDLAKGSKRFPTFDNSNVVIKSILASSGEVFLEEKPSVAIVSTGSELLAPGQQSGTGKIYDSNTTMLAELLAYFGFDCKQKLVLGDDFEQVKASFRKLFEHVKFVICSGGVSMGDKDYIKPVLRELGFNIHFGRVNMKPGKPMTFATNGCGCYFFGLPGNPVSAFVTFHLFALPALRSANGWQREKLELATITVILENDYIDLDARPEYMRASITSKNSSLYAKVNGNQMSSRLQSIVGADVLLHLPACDEQKTRVVAGDLLRASILRYDFISKYE